MDLKTYNLRDAGGTGRERESFLDHTESHHSALCRRLRRTEIPLSKVGSHHVTLRLSVPFGIEKVVVREHPSGLKFCLVWVA